MSAPSEAATANGSSAFPPPSPSTSTSNPATTSHSSASPAALSSYGSTAPQPPPSTLVDLPLVLIDAHHDHNERFALHPDRLRELADSIAHVGLINPVRVTPEGDRYRLRTGYRRLEACRLLGRTTIPAIVDRVTANQDVTERLAENLFRADLTPVEEAHAVRRLRQTTGQTDQQLAGLLNRSTNWVRHRLDLAFYPEPILEDLHAGHITLAVADELALVRDPVQQSALLDAATRNGCSARTAQLWRTHANANIADPTRAPTAPPGPPVAGPPPVVQKQCFACHTPCDITTMSYVVLCPTCLSLLTSPPAPPTPSAPNP